MPATREQAVDEMLSLFKAAWDARPESQLIPVLWPNVRGDVDTTRQLPTDAAQSWCRVTVQTVRSEQRSISMTDGLRRYETEGLLTVEIYVPTSSGSGLAYRLVQVALNAFRGSETAHGVTFRNARPREIGNDGNWFRVDALVEFSFDEVG